MYVLEERLAIIKWHHLGHSLQQIANLFAVRFVGRATPTRSTISRLIRHFEQSGCLNSCSKCTPRQSTAGVVEARETRDVMVCAVVEENSNKSLHKIQEDTGVPKSTARSILKKYKYTSYKYSTCHEIFPADGERRMQFSEIIIERIHADNNFSSNILFTDECTFALHSKHNPNNLRYWSTENENRHLNLRTQYPQKVNVWAGVLGNSVIGPFFIDGNLNGAVYLDLLQNRILPSVREVAENLDSVWFQQDGCPAHEQLQVRNFLNNNFPNRLISNSGNILWPARSPDLTVMDFFFGGM